MVLTSLHPDPVQRVIHLASICLSPTKSTCLNGHRTEHQYSVVAHVVLYTCKKIHVSLNIFYVTNRIFKKEQKMLRKTFAYLKNWRSYGGLKVLCKQAKNVLCFFYSIRTSFNFANRQKFYITFFCCFLKVLSVT